MHEVVRKRGATEGGQKKKQKMRLGFAPPWASMPPSLL